MSAPKLKLRYTVDQYLAMERSALERHLYPDGEIFAMAGESDEHGEISVNVVVSLGAQLKDKSCRARTRDTKVRSGPIPESGHGTKGLFSYPDILVVCGEPEFHDAHKDILLNPTVIIEILSESTEAFDRGGKFHRYQTHNPTLIDYILVAQDRPKIDHFTKQSRGGWTYKLCSGLESSVVIASIGCTLKFMDVYDRVRFAPEEVAQP